jgi:hypothetical protein
MKKKIHRHKWSYADTCPICGESYEVCISDDECEKIRINGKEIRNS